MTFRKAVLTLAVLLLATAPLALAQGTYTQIDYPGAVQTECWGIDNAGDVVGEYVDGLGISHGFLLSGGAYSTIDYPHLRDTGLYGINDVGQIVGFAQVQGFLYDTQTQLFTPVNRPGASYSVLTGINDEGTIVGYSAGASGNYFRL